MARGSPASAPDLLQAGPRIGGTSRAAPRFSDLGPVAGRPPDREGPPATGASPMIAHETGTTRIDHLFALMSARGDRWASLVRSTRAWAEAVAAGGEDADERWR